MATLVPRPEGGTLAGSSASAEEINPDIRWWVNVAFWGLVGLHTVHTLHIYWLYLQHKARFDSRKTSRSAVVAEKSSAVAVSGAGSGPRRKLDVQPPRGWEGSSATELLTLSSNEIRRHEDLAMCATLLLYPLTLSVAFISLSKNSGIVGLEYFKVVALMVVIFYIILRVLRQIIRFPMPMTPMDTVNHLVSPSIPPHERTRVSWTCRCGRTFTEVIQELKPGAAIEWAYQMNGDRLNPSPGPTSPASWRARACKYFGQGERDSPPNQLPSSRSKPTPPGTEASSRHGPFSPRRSEYVLLCIKTDGARLFHANITDKATDEEMFQELHDHYQATQAWYEKLMSLKTLQLIDFIRFHVYYTNQVAIGQNDIGSMPLPGNPEYIYLPQPPDTDPIIPYNALLHFFHNPSHAGSKSFHRDRMVKRLDSRLILGPDQALQVGWGIRFKEKLYWPKIILLEGVIGLVGAGVGASWYFRTGDIQGAASITAVVLGYATIVLGLVHGFSEGFGAADVNS